MERIPQKFNRTPKSLTSRSHSGQFRSSGSALSARLALAQRLLDVCSVFGCPRNAMRTTMKAIKQSTQNIKTKRKRAPRSFVAALLPAPEQRNTHISHRSGHKCTTLRAACETFAWKTANVGRHTVGCQLPFCLSKWRNQITLLEHTTLSVVAER